jgi:transcriptional regulator GlxA family with amidase domain
MRYQRKKQDGSVDLLNVRKPVTELEVDFRLRCMLEYAWANLRDDLSLQRLAAIANISEWHICRLFRQEMGISPARYVKVLRLGRAADLLEATSLSVKQVMSAVGLNDESHFVRDFKSLIGEYPMQYRGRIRGQSAQTARMANICQSSPKGIGCTEYVKFAK